ARRPGPGVGRRGEGGPVRAVRASVRLAAGHGRAVGGRPEDPARPVDPGRGPGAAGRRAQLHAAEKIAERTKLLSQLEQAKMQEQAAASLRQMSELAAPGKTPSLEAVRDKIER